MESLEKRMTELSTGASGAAGSAAGSSDGVRRQPIFPPALARDLVYEQDPCGGPAFDGEGTAKGSGKGFEVVQGVVQQQPHHLAHGLLWGSVPTSTASSSRGARDEEHEHFVSSKVFLKGFCPYKKVDQWGLKKEVLTAAVAPLLALLSGDEKSWLAAEADLVHAPRYLNSQLQINIAESAPVDAAVLLCKRLNALLETHPLAMQIAPQHKAFFSEDKELWKKQRNGSLFRHKCILESFGLPPDRVVHVDWVGCTLYLKGSGRDVAAGHYSLKTTEFTWAKDAMAPLYVGRNLDALDSMET
jgi:hypothetical protein